MIDELEDTGRRLNGEHPTDPAPPMGMDPHIDVEGMVRDHVLPKLKKLEDEVDALRENVRDRFRLLKEDVNEIRASHEAMIKMVTELHAEMLRKKKESA